MIPSAEQSNWSEWFELYGPKLLLCARQWTRSVADAEDVVQEAFVRFWKSQRQLGGEPLPLLITSIRRSALDLARREERRQRREDRSAELPEAEDCWFQMPLAPLDERQLALEAALRALPSEQREVLALKIWGELSFEQIAEQLQISPNTAASRYRYALATLKKNLNPVGP